MSNVNVWAEVVCWSISVSEISEFNRKKMMNNSKKAIFNLTLFPCPNESIFKPN